MRDPEPLDPDEEYRRRFEEREFLREIEEAQEQLERNTRTLTEFLHEAMAAGSFVTVELGEASVSGHLVGVGQSIARVCTRGWWADVNVDAITSVRAGVDRHPVDHTAEAIPPTFVARLRELAGSQQQTAVRLVTTSGQEVDGQVEAASDAHVELRDPGGDQWALPVQRVAVVRVPTPGT